VLTLTHGATVISLKFDSAFTGDHFKLTTDGGTGTDVTLVAGAGATFASLAGDVTNFVGSNSLLKSEKFLPGGHGLNSGLTLADPAAQVLGACGIASHTSVDHGLSHAIGAMFKA
jgi:hypothetical protein